MPSLTARDFCLVSVIAVVAFSSVFRMPLILDDHDILERGAPTASWSWPQIKADFTSNIYDDPHQSHYYRPLTTLSERFDRTLWGSHRLFGYHVTNLLWHLAAALLAGTLLLYLGFSSGAASVLACLFVAMPAGADLQLLITARAESMALAASLLCIILLLRNGWRPAMGASLAFAVALFSKESAIVTPAAIGLIYLAQRRRLSQYLNLWPLAAIALLYLGWRAHIMGPLFDPTLQDAPFQASGVMTFFVAAFPRILFHYARIVVAPFDLYYPQLLPVSSPHWPFYLVGLGLVAAGLWRLAPRWGLFCLGWFMMQLLPKIPIMLQTGGMLDHWVYPAALGLLLLPAVGLASAMARPEAIVRRTGILLFAGCLAISATLCRLTIHRRNTDEKSYRWALEHDPGMNVIRYKLAATLLQEGRAQEALAYFLEAYQREPGNLHYGNGLVIGLWRAGKPAQAVRLAESLEKMAPKFEATQTNLAEMRSRLKHPK